MNKLTRAQWEELDDQLNRMPAESDPEGVPGEHLMLIALLNRFGFNRMSKAEQDTPHLTAGLLGEG
ncbi:MAG TPA: hypothetical protein VLT51_00120 [Anaerolineales bacterium]|nr:hypothetical protein [Anaerolineales bacterium]